MNNTHGDILHNPSTTSNGPSLNDLVYRMKTEDIAIDGLPSNQSSQSQGNYQPPRGEVGWICPVCGRGLAPSTSYCPCRLTRDITYSNDGVTIKGVTIKGVVDGAIDCKSTPPQAYFTTTATNASK